jgi:hypothetical protein
VVSTGLLALLTPAEQEAVLHHEAAHIRLGHPRILLLGAVIARSYRWLPPARLAWTRLRRDLEAAADDEAAAAVGTAPLLSALAKVALAAAASPAPGSGDPAGLAFAEPGDLRYRIRRLQQPQAPDARATLTCAWPGRCLHSRSPGPPARHCTPVQSGQPYSPAWPGSATWAGGRHGTAGRPFRGPARGGSPGNPTPLPDTTLRPGGRTARSAASGSRRKLMTPVLSPG